MPETAVMLYRCQKEESERNDTRCLCFAARAEILLNFFSASESCHTTNILLGAQQTSRYWHTDISKLCWRKSHSLSLRQSDTAEPPSHSVALGYISFSGLMKYFSGKKNWRLFLSVFISSKSLKKNLQLTLGLHDTYTEDLQGIIKNIWRSLRIQSLLG